MRDRIAGDDRSDDDMGQREVLETRGRGQDEAGRIERTDVESDGHDPLVLVRLSEDALRHVD